jgi:hypothetical protein
MAIALWDYCASNAWESPALKAVPSVDNIATNASSMRSSIVTRKGHEK